MRWFSESLQYPFYDATVPRPLCFASSTPGVVSQGLSSSRSQHLFCTRSNSILSSLGRSSDVLSSVISHILFLMLFYPFSSLQPPQFYWVFYRWFFKVTVYFSLLYRILQSQSLRMKPKIRLKNLLSNYFRLSRVLCVSIHVSLSNYWIGRTICAFLYVLWISLDIEEEISIR